MMAVVSVAYLLHYGLKVDDWTKFIFHFIRLGTKLNFYWFRKLLGNINVMYNIIESAAKIYYISCIPIKFSRYRFQFNRVFTSLFNLEYHKFKELLFKVETNRSMEQKIFPQIEYLRQNLKNLKDF